MKSVAAHVGSRKRFSPAARCARNFSPSRRSRPATPFRLLITGGSQGASAINRAFVDAMDLLAARKNESGIVHQTGERDYNAVRTGLCAARNSTRRSLLSFTNMAERFAQADLIVCRAGAITVAEIAAAGRAAIFIPFGAATDSHQLRNAQEMVRAGAARLIAEPELTRRTPGQRNFCASRSARRDASAWRARRARLGTAQRRARHRQPDRIGCKIARNRARASA